jgi:hypothetical protein
VSVGVGVRVSECGVCVSGGVGVRVSVLEVLLLQLL